MTRKSLRFDRYQLPRSRLGPDSAAKRRDWALVVFRVRIQARVLGFLGISIACAVMASAFGRSSRRSAILRRRLAA